ncbi:MAG: tetratricopeptide repeat protein [Candidatus Margulisbacteria bacterium]|jgi:tetratricopeptide (TPR) repeat protein|nr:tetratricopeptide repeat protein [Candidatus Margulisiibacteriota bacterium]
MRSKPGEPWLERYFLQSFRPYLWIGLIGFLLYCRTLFFGFVYLDDNTLILENIGFLGNLGNLFQSFRQDVFRLLPNADAYYRPLLTVSFIFDAQLGGANPFFYHLTNILLHLLSASLLFAFLVRLGYQRGPSLVFALLFTAHPVLAQAVAWIPGRNDTLLTLFVLPAFIFLIDYDRTGKRADYGRHLLFFLLALFTKETAAIIVVLGLLYLYLIAEENLFSAKVKWLLAGWLATGAAYFWLRQTALIKPLQAKLSDVVPAGINNLPALIQFTGKIFFPLNLSVLPVIKDTTLVFGVIALVILACLLWTVKRERRNRALFGSSWFILFLLPTLFYCNPAVECGTNFHLEHRLYLPLVGMIIVLMESRLVAWLSGKRVLLVGLLLACFAGLTLLHQAHFTDRLTFWTNAARTSPHSPLAHRNLGAMFWLDGQVERAEQEYLKAQELNPGEPMVHNNLGLIYLNRGQLAAAEREFLTELQYYPDYDNALFNLGLLYARQGERRKAAALWQRTLDVNPLYDDARRNLEILRAH